MVLFCSVVTMATLSGLFYSAAFNEGYQFGQETERGNYTPAPLNFALEDNLSAYDASNRTAIVFSYAETPFKIEGGSNISISNTKTFYFQLEEGETAKILPFTDDNGDTYLRVEQSGAKTSDKQP